MFAHNPKSPKRLLWENMLSTLGLFNLTAHKDKVRRMPAKLQEAATKQINEMLKNGIIRESNFRKLNRITIKDTYSLPNVNDMLDRFKR